MVKYRESIIFVDVFCPEHDLDANNLMVSDFAKASHNFCSFWTCKMHFVWQAQDAANLMVSDFAKA